MYPTKEALKGYTRNSGIGFASFHIFCVSMYVDSAEVRGQHVEIRSSTWSVASYFTHGLILSDPSLPLNAGCEPGGTGRNCVPARRKSATYVAPACMCCPFHMPCSLPKPDLWLPTPTCWAHCQGPGGDRGQA